MKTPSKVYTHNSWHIRMDRVLSESMLYKSKWFKIYIYNIKIVQVVLNDDKIKKYSKSMQNEHKEIKIRISTQMKSVVNAISTKYYYWR